MREAAELQVEELPHQVEDEQQHHHGQEEDIDEPVLAQVGDAADLAEHAADAVLLGAVALQLLEEHLLVVHP